MAVFVQFCFIFFQLITGSLSSKSVVNQLYCFHKHNAVNHFQQYLNFNPVQLSSSIGRLSSKFGTRTLSNGSVMWYKRRVAYLNMSDSNSSCASIGLYKLYQSHQHEVRVCGSSGASCTSVINLHFLQSWLHTEQWNLKPLCSWN